MDDAECPSQASSKKMAENVPVDNPVASTSGTQQQQKDKKSSEEPRGEKEKDGKKRVKRYKKSLTCLQFEWAQRQPQFQRLRRKFLKKYE